jgi:hypothetical protein
MSEAEAPAAPAKTREQVVAQYRVVAHLARQIALVHEQMAETYAHPDVPMTESGVDLSGRWSASRMETLGDMLNNMDAADPEDAWVTPIFRVAQATWPQSE